MPETRRIDSKLWTDGLQEYEGDPVVVEAERTDVNEVALHTFIDGRGSMVSFYFDRESALDFATAILDQARLGAKVNV